MKSLWLEGENVDVSPYTFVHGGCIMKATLIVVNLYYFIIEHISLLVKMTY